jgi:thiamine biosynthesis lipoprotein
MVLILLGFWRWLQDRRAGRKVEETVLVMDTVARVVAYGPAGRTALDAATAELRRWENLASCHAGGPLGQVNRAAGRGPVEVERSLARLVDRALETALETDGAFEPTLGAVVGLWQFGDGSAPPDSAALRRTLDLVDRAAVRVDTTGAVSFVEILRPGVVLDLGGIAKGWAADRAAARAMDAGAWAVLVDAGGDIRMMGRRPGGRWRIGVRDPRAKGGILTILELDGGAVATSGDYERYFEHNGIRYHHLLDPHSGMPARGCRSVSVVCEHAWRADALATALFVMGPERGLAYARSVSDVEALIVDEASGVRTTQGLRGTVGRGFRLAG